MRYEATDGMRRREQDLRRLGTRTPRCPHCTEAEPTALVRNRFGIICIECLKLRRRETPTELHHLAGQHNDPTVVQIMANDHSVLSDLQKDWPVETLRNPDGSPLRRISATILGWLDVMRLIIERTVGKIPAQLDRLDEALCAHIGERWWETIGFEPAP